MSKLTKEMVLKKAKDDGIELVDLQFTDYMGTIKSVTIPAHKLADTLDHGCWFDGSSVEGFARIHEADMYLVPDPTTYATVPWRADKGGTARLICDIYKADDSAFLGDPRGILKRVVNEAKEMGFILNAGPEYEFFMFPKDDEGNILMDAGSNDYYFTHPLDETYEIRKEMTSAIEQFGIEIEASHYEVAERQHEIDFKYSDALTAADSSITLKYVVKNIASLYRYHATFMPKPIEGLNGSGMHTHMSLADIKTGKNLFYDAKDKYSLSKTAYSFIAGVLKYVDEFTALIAPTVNSYKRLTPGYEAPCYICWARKNRSALVRVPAVRKEAVEATRVELRCPDPGSNPYLTIAAMFKAGLQGIKEGLSATNPVEEDIFEFDDAKLKQYYINELPHDLRGALSKLEKSTLMKELLGDHTFERYLEIKKQEWNDFRLAVTDWERERYLVSL